MQWKVLTKIETLEKEIIGYRIVGERTGEVCRGGRRVEFLQCNKTLRCQIMRFIVVGVGYWQELRVNESRFLLLLTRSDRSDPF